MKFDTGTIENFDGLTAEQLREVIKGIEIPEDNSEAFNKLKASFNKTSSELAAAKKELKSKQTEDEQRANEKAEADRELQEKYNELLKESTVSKYVNKLSALGMDEKSALTTANAIFDGDTDTLFSSLSALRESNEKSIRADIAKSAPRIESAGGNAKYKTMADIMAIKDATERQAAIAENIELFGGNAEEE